MTIHSNQNHLGAQSIFDRGIDTAGVNTLAYKEGHSSGTINTLIGNTRKNDQRIAGRNIAMHASRSLKSQGVLLGNLQQQSKQTD